MEVAVALLLLVKVLQVVMVLNQAQEAVAVVQVL
jgi:hypothetical protein